MIIWGINANNHDAAISVVDGASRDILFAGHAERYSRVKNDLDLNQGLIKDALLWGGYPEQVVWFENPWGRKLRYLQSGQYDLLLERSPKAYLLSHGLTAPVAYSNHHRSHAAAGYFTSGFDEAAVVVIDAIGETTTASIWKGAGTKLSKLWELKYPHSIGLFYSAVTDLVGLKPNEEEYILMGMAAYGEEELCQQLVAYLLSTYFKSTDRELQQSFNFHKGLRGDVYLAQFAQTDWGKFGLALAAQRIVEAEIEKVFKLARKLTQADNIVYSGGVALNCVANHLAFMYADNVWIMPNPGDAGNSLGAAAAYVGKQLNWNGPFLGHNIQRPLSIEAIIEHLLTEGMCGVATGRAEFGPRALGNRSLLADPRRPDAKSKVNDIKQRQQFRPFAPAVLEEHRPEYFELPWMVRNSPYMQYVGWVLEPEKLPAISHINGTARVQTVGAEAPVLRAILEAWYAKTGCPVLLNTSLNIKGEPLVNSIDDAVRWENKYSVKVF